MRRFLVPYIIYAAVNIRNLTFFFHVRSFLSVGSNAGKAVAVYLFNQLCTAAADNNAVSITWVSSTVSASSILVLWVMMSSEP